MARLSTNDERRSRDIDLLHNTVLRDVVGETVTNESFRDMLLATLDEARAKIEDIRVEGDAERKRREKPNDGE